jgi:hypothetical protein
LNVQWSRNTEALRNGAQKFELKVHFESPSQIQAALEEFERIKNKPELYHGLREVRQDFPSFHVTRAYKRWMHGPPLPVSWLPLGRLLGWHLWVHLRPIKPAR